MAEYIFMCQVFLSVTFILCYLLVLSLYFAAATNFSWVPLHDYIPTWTNIHMETGVLEEWWSNSITRHFSMVLQRGIPATSFIVTFTCLCGLRMYQAFGADDDAIVTEFIENSILVNCQLMTRNCKSWLTGRFTGILIHVERNQRMEVDFITQKHL